MTRSNKDATLVNILMSQYQEAPAEVEKEALPERDLTNDELNACYIEPLQECVAKHLLGADYLEDAKNYRLVTTSEGFSIVCDTEDEGEKVFYCLESFHPEQHVTDNTKVEESVEKVDYLSILSTLGLGLFAIIVIALILVLRVGV